MCILLVDRGWRQNGVESLSLVLERDKRWELKRVQNILEREEINDE